MFKTVQLLTMIYFMKARQLGHLNKYIEFLLLNQIKSNHFNIPLAFLEKVKFLIILTVTATEIHGPFTQSGHHSLILINWNISWFLESIKNGTNNFFDILYFKALPSYKCQNRSKLSGCWWMARVSQVFTDNFPKHKYIYIYIFHFLT